MQKRQRPNLHPTEHPMLKVFVGSVVGLVLLIVGFWGTVRLYSRWQEKRLVQRTYAYIDAGDVRGASLTAQHVLELQPHSAPAARAMAMLAERLGDRSAIDWRLKISKWEPKSIDDLIALARCYLQFGDVDRARETLGGTPDSAKNKAAYHVAAASVAQAKQQDDAAIAEWSEAVKLAPGNKDYELQYAVCRLRSSKEDVHVAAVSALTTLRQDKSTRVPATRALIDDGIARRENARELVALASDLQGYPEATLKERLLYLDFLHQLDDPQFSSYLTELEKRVSVNPTDTASLLAWMSQNNLSLLGLDFTRTLSSDLLEKWPIPLGLNQIYSRLQDWKKLEQLTKGANWQRFEFLRHACLARALRGQDKPAAAEHEWQAAIESASQQPDAPMLLMRTASDWGWTNETLDLLWSVSKDPDKQKQAFQTLYQYYARNGDTQGLFRVLGRLAEAEPNNLDIQNNRAQVSLLLRAQMDDARRTAADVYQKAPTNPAYATTQAYALLTKGDTTGALRVMSSLSEDQRNDPAISAYYGLCLAETGDERARQFLERGKQAKLLPEEKELVDKALLKLNAADQGPR